MNPSRGITILGLSVVLAALALTALSVGAVKIPPREIFWAPMGDGMDARFEGVLWHLRLPRVALGVVVGAALSVAGALVQGLFRNPLADPGLIGLSSGAALGAVFVIVLGSVIFPNVPVLSNTALLPVAAFLGAFAVTYFVRRLAATGGYTSMATLLLAGVLAGERCHRGKYIPRHGRAIAHANVLDAGKSRKRELEDRKPGVSHLPCARSDCAALWSDTQCAGAGRGRGGPFGIFR